MAVTAVKSASYLVARFLVDDSNAQTINYAKLWTGSGEIISPPRLRYGGVSFSILARNGTPVMTTLASDQAIQGSSTETPDIL